MLEKQKTGGNISALSMFRRRLTVLGLLAVGGVFAACPALADYPTKPVPIFLPFAASGIGDINFRLVAATLRRSPSAHAQMHEPGEASGDDHAANDGI